MHEFWHAVIEGLRVLLVAFGSLATLFILGKLVLIGRALSIRRTLLADRKEKR